MKKDFAETGGIKGILSIKHRDNLTGEIVDESYEELNVVLDQGRTIMLRAFSTSDNTLDTVKTIKIGDDVGAGDIFEPTPASPSLTEADQNVVYEVPVEEFFVEFPTSGSVRYLATINGADVMSLNPGVANIIYTSAAIYTQGGNAVTFKRFPARTISSLISVEISWTLILTWENV